MNHLKSYESWNSFGGDVDVELSLKEVIDMSQLSDVEDVGTWLDKDIEDIKYYFRKEPMQMFMEQADEMEGTLDEFLDEKERTEKIETWGEHLKKIEAAYNKIEQTEVIGFQAGS